MSDEKEVYVNLTLPIGSPVRLPGLCDSYLLPWQDLESRITELLEQDGAEDGPVAMTFEILRFTDQELEAYCERHEIEWGA